MQVRTRRLLALGAVLALVVAPVVASAGAGASTPETADVGPTVDRTVSQERIPFGASVTVELTVTVASDRSDLTIRDGYAGAEMDSLVRDAAVRSVRIDGERAADRVDRAVADDDGVTVRVNDVEAGETVSVTYSVRTHHVVVIMVEPPPTVTASLAFTGVDGSDVVADGATAEFEDDEVTVTNRQGGESPVDRILGDGEVTDEELRRAVELWVRGDLSNRGLSTVFDVWVTGGAS